MVGKGSWQTTLETNLPVEGRPCLSSFITRGGAGVPRDTRVIIYLVPLVSFLSFFSILSRNRNFLTAVPFSTQLSKNFPRGSSFPQQACAKKKMKTLVSYRGGGGRKESVYACIVANPLNRRFARLGEIEDTWEEREVESQI